MPFEDEERTEWITRASALRYFGLADDDDGWDELNEIVDEFDIDAEVGENGDVLRINSNDPGMREALAERHKRQVGHRPDDPEKVKEARDRLTASEKARKRRRREARRQRLPRRIAERRRDRRPRGSE
jgi:hypothetical protein